jgi:P pilus assembly chaperone PapD
MCFPTFALLRRIRLASCAALLLALSWPAQAELMLHPTRIVFDKNQRAAQVELINNGSKPASYRISLVNRRMTDAGQFEPADTPGEGEHFADGMLRYSPRQVTLQPGTAQTVRIMLRKPADLAEGEYRSHLLFDKLPEPDAGTSIENRGAEGE